jgi:hypothetical protein
VEETDPCREHQVEPSVAEIEVLEVGDEELRLARRDVRRVACPSRLDHLRGAVDRGEAPGVQQVAHHRRGDTGAAPDLEHPVVRPDVERLDDPAQPLAHPGTVAQGSEPLPTRDHVIRGRTKA